MSVAVVVPWQSGCPHREAAWVAVRGWYETAGQTVEVGELEPGETWCKARAVMPAIEATTAAIVVVADADCWSDQLGEAIARVEKGAPWAIPHGRVRRLTEQSTRSYIGGESPARLTLEEPPYMGAPSGGLVVLPRTTALDVPLDPRFVGYGGEDRSWGRALRLLAGEPWRGTANLWHLWHPPQERTDRNHGSAATEALRGRYRAARQNEPAMRMLIEEARSVT